MRFDGRVAIVTGAASGIGKATAELLAREGCKVMIADVSDAGSKVAAALCEQGAQATHALVDVSREDQVAGMVEATVGRWGRLDILVANAGVSGRGVAERIELSDWQRVLGVNLTGVLLCAKHAIPPMRARGGGAIVSTASVFGLVGTHNAVPYAAAKGALVNMARSMALDCAADGIRVNTVCPGFLTAPTCGTGRGEDMENRALIALHPLGRLGEPEDVAKAIAFLASDDASFITGTSLVVDGGYTAR